MPDADWAPEPEPVIENPFDWTQVKPEPVPEMVPNHRASETMPPPEEKRSPLRDALLGKKQANQRVRDTRTPKPRKIVNNRPGQFISPLTDFYNTVAMVAMPFKPEVSMALMGPAHAPTEEVPNPPTVAENCAKAWDEAAQRSERIRNFLDSFLTASVFGTLIAAHAPVIFAAMPSRFSPAAAMEEMLKRQAEQES